MLIGEVIPQLHNYLRLNQAAQERTEFRHILVDEFQDLDRAEQGVIELLSEGAEVCIVGDDDQSIYSFKHAHPVGIREWLDANGGADDLGLDDCRRCPTRVVEMARNLIENNINRPVPRPLRPMEANGGGDVRIAQFAGVDAEVRGIAQEVDRLIAEGIPAGDILVLAQSRAFGTPIYEALLQRGVPAKSYYAESELNGQEAQRAFALLKLFVNRQDRVALRWRVGLNGNMWHASGYRRIREHCEHTGDSPWDTLVQLSDRALRLPYTRGIVAAFDEIRETLNELEAHEGLEGVVNSLFPDGDHATRDIRNLALNILPTIVDNDRDAFLDGMIAAITQPEIPTEIQEVRIMSLHKSKGLSAPVTIIAGCVQGLLPRPPSEDMTPGEAEEHLEEQRRLFYVGITRVKAAPREGKPEALLLTYSTEMPVRDALAVGITPAAQQYGRAILHASRFIAELGPAAPDPVRG